MSNINRKDFLKTVSSLGLLGGSNLLTGGLTALFATKLNDNNPSNKITNLEKEITNLEKKIEEQHTLIEILSSYVSEDDSKLDYTKHPQYKKVKEFETYLEEGIKKYSYIFPVNKLFMIALAQIESSLNPKAISQVGAAGIWQFMPETARKYGLHVDDNSNYNLALLSRSSRKKDGKVLDELEKKLKKFMRENSNKIGFNNENEFTEHLKSKNNGILDKYSNLVSELNNQRAIYTSGRSASKETHYKDLYVLELKKLSKLPLLELIKHDERFDIKKSTYAIVHFMANNLKKAQGNYIRALSMDNADDSFVGILPYQETINHIDRVIHTYFMLRRKLLSQEIKSKVSPTQPLFY